MATQTIVTLIDDLDGSSGPDIESVEFSIDGIAYALDLREYNAAKLREVLQPYVAVARRVSSPNRQTQPKQRQPRRARPGGRTLANDIREWAGTAGYHVNDRGRIPEAVVLAYNETHGIS